MTYLRLAGLLQTYVRYLQAFEDFVQKFHKHYDSAEEKDSCPDLPSPRCCIIQCIHPLAHPARSLRLILILFPS